MSWLRRYAGGLTLVGATVVLAGVGSHDAVLAGLAMLSIGVIGLAYALTEDIATIGGDMRRYPAVGRFLVWLPRPLGTIVACLMSLVFVGLGIVAFVDQSAFAPTPAPVGSTPEPLAATGENTHTTVRGTGYAVVMPGTPSHFEQTFGTGAGIERSATYMSVRGDENFEFDAVSIPAAAVRRGGDDPVREAAAVLRALASGATGTRYAGHPAWDDMAPASTAGSKTTFLRIVRAGTQTFELSVQVDRSVRTLPAVYRRFRASLRIG